MATKQVRFYELVKATPGGSQRLKAASWQQLLVEFLAKTDGAISGPDGAQLMGWSSDVSPAQLRIGEVTDRGPGINRGRWSAPRESQPLEPDRAQGEFFSRMTYVQFLDRCNIVAVVAGSGRVNDRRVLALINEIAPLPDGGEWILAPIVQPAQLKEANGLLGASSIRVSSRVDPAGLLKGSGTQASLEDMLAEIAANYGAGIRVGLSLSIEQPKEHPGAIRALKDSVLQSSGLISRAKQVELTGTGADLARKIVNLVEHEVTAQVDISDDAADETLEQVILQELKSVCEERHTQVENLVRLEG